MQRIGERAARLFKSLAGQEADEDMSSYVIAVYVFLLVVAMMLLLAWTVGGPMERGGGGGPAAPSSPPRSGPRLVPRRGAPAVATHGLADDARNRLAVGQPQSSSTGEMTYAARQSRP